MHRGLWRWGLGGVWSAVVADVMGAAPVVVGCVESRRTSHAASHTQPHSHTTIQVTASHTQTHKHTGSIVNTRAWHEVTTHHHPTPPRTGPWVSGGTSWATARRRTAAAGTPTARCCSRGGPCSRRQGQRQSQPRPPHLATAHLLQRRIPAAACTAPPAAETVRGTQPLPQAESASPPTRCRGRGGPGVAATARGAGHACGHVFRARVRQHPPHHQQ